jgi:hypothetical protein
MNIELEIRLKIKANEEATEPRKPVFACLVDKIAAHPCVVMLLREIVRNS